MGQEVVTELVIDADGATAGANVFTQAMAGAEQAANQGVASLSGLNLGFLGVGAGATAAVAGIKALLDYVVSANKDLADMSATAHQVGLTLTDFQGLQFGGAIKGLSTDQINAGLEKSASLLNDASRNSNSLSKELEANGLSIKNANGQLISENQLLGTAANLIKNANNPGDQLVIAQMLGFTKEWIPLLEQGAGAMSGLSAEARAAGAVIDDETIQKAVDFDSQWRKSSVEFSTYMKAALSSLLPYVDDLIQGAASFVNSIDKAKIQKASDESFKKFNEATGIPESGVINVDITDKTHQALQEFQSASVFSLDFWAAAGRIFSSSVHFMTPEQASQSIPGYAASQINEPTYPTAAQMDAAFDKANPADPGSRAHPLPGLSVADYAAAGGTKIPGKDTGAGTDAVDRAINQLQKHTEQQLADAKAVGLGDGALAGFKAEAAETAAVLANGGKETDAQADKFADLKDAAIAAADALAKAKVAGQIEFGSKTAFLSAGDIAIANQLKGIYGNDVPKALASTEAAALRTNEAMKGLSSAIESNLTTGLTDIATGAKSASQGFRDMGLAIMRAIDEMIIKILIVQPLMRALQASIGGGSGVLGILGLGGASGVTSAGAIAGAAGPTSVGGAPLVGLHGGGIVGSEATFSRYVHPAYFDHAPKFHGGGIAGDEVPIIARKGEGVFTQGQMAALGNAGSPVVHYHIDASGADSGTVERIKQVLGQHAKAITSQGKAMASSQRFQASGVA